MLFDLAIGVVIVAGLVGAIIQIIPGLILVGAAVLVWGIVTGGALGWGVAGFAVFAVAVGMVLKYMSAGTYLARHGVPNRSIVVGACAGIVGFFVIPLIGLFVGFVAGVYLAELQRLSDPARAWPATIAALKATGLSILVELVICLLMAVVWVGALVVR